jgi:N-acetylglucosamine kinase-like BadF-type ATPase
VAVVTDLALSLEAAGERPAIVLIAGTGSAAIGWDGEGRLARVGGYGRLVSDQGSAFDIGRQAIVSSLRERDETRMDTPLGKEILRKLQCPSWREVQERAETSADELFPNVFPIIASAADSGDERARKLLSEAAHELARLIGILVKLFGIEGAPFLLAKTGGMLGRSKFLDAEIDRRLQQIAPAARIGSLPIAPVEAAARVALQMSKNKASN